MKQNDALKSVRRFVVKVGSALVTNQGEGLDDSLFRSWASQISHLKRAGKEVVLVSSGAVAEGVARMGWSSRPSRLHELQAAAAIGQMGLVQAYEKHFQAFGFHAGQVLLTHKDLSDRQSYLNARSTLLTMLEMGVIPVINENDTLATDEIKFGDNDTLAALVANLLEADLLVILTDQLGMFTSDPRENPNAQMLEVVKASDVTLMDMASGSAGGLGRGGMLTKVKAAQLASRSGASTVIASGAKKDVLLSLARGCQEGTLFVSDLEPMSARKRWIAGNLKASGSVILDAGAVSVIREQGKSLLPVGVTAVNGEFSRGELVECYSPSRELVAKGLVNYSSDEAKSILGMPSSKIERILGYRNEESLVSQG